MPTSGWCLCFGLFLALFWAISQGVPSEVELSRFCNFDAASGDLTLEELIYNITSIRVSNRVCSTPPAGAAVIIRSISRSASKAKPVDFIFSNVTFGGNWNARLEFVGGDSSSIVEHILADLPYEFASQMDESVTVDTIYDLFSDRNTLRISDSPLSTDPGTEERFSQYVKSKISEVLPCPLVVEVNGSRFVGGASITFTGVMPVGTSISFTNCQFEATYQDIYGMSTSEVVGNAFITLYLATIFSSRIAVLNVTIAILHGLPLSIQSDFFTNETNYYGEGVRSEVQLLRFLNQVCFHSSEMVMENISLSVQATAFRLAEYVHPNASALAQLIAKHNISATAQKSIVVNSPIPSVAVFGTAYDMYAQNAQNVLITDGSTVTLSSVNIHADGSSAHLAVTDDTWLHSSNSSGNITLDEFRLTSSEQQCYVLEVPTVVKAAALSLAAAGVVLIRNSSFIISAVNMTSHGHQPRGGRALAEDTAFKWGYGESYILNVSEMSPTNLKSVAMDMLTALNRTALGAEMGSCVMLRGNLTAVIASLEIADPIGLALARISLGDIIQWCALNKRHNEKPCFKYAAL